MLSAAAAQCVASSGMSKVYGLRMSPRAHQHCSGCCADRCGTCGKTHPRHGHAPVRAAVFRQQWYSDAANVAEALGCLLPRLVDYTLTYMCHLTPNNMCACRQCPLVTKCE
jgi:hypothetical protein